MSTFDKIQLVTAIILGIAIAVIILNSDNV